MENNTKIRKARSFHFHNIRFTSKKQTLHISIKFFTRRLVHEKPERDTFLSSPPALTSSDIEGEYDSKTTATRAILLALARKLYEITALPVRAKYFTYGIVASAVAL